MFKVAEFEFDRYHIFKIKNDGSNIVI